MTSYDMNFNISVNNRISYPCEITIFPFSVERVDFYGSERKIIQYSQNTFIVSGNIE
jgi:hypothetical protein